MLYVVLLNEISTQRSIVSFKGILVNRDSMSKPAIKRLESNVKSSSEKENESLIEYSLDVKGASKGTKIFTILYVGVPISDKIGQKGGTPSLIGLCILAQPYEMPGLDPTGCKSLYFLSKI